MSNANTGNLGCRHCRYYRTEGQRGGQCQMLGVPVRGIWPACSLVVPPFAPSWEVSEQSRDGSYRDYTRQLPTPLQRTTKKENLSTVYR